ncbi:MAG: EVE domain-containing protein [Candidatus Omnitrophica bacterium]|nr:EVE domain-containing protein [Candidatus Omnitrophota bacterium]
MGRNYWLLKSEPEAYSIDDLSRDKSTYWDGVRNYQARNFLRDSLKKGDRVFFYHSNAEPPGIAGIAEVTKEGYPDPSQFDPKDVHYDAKSDPRDPTWFVVEIKFVKKFREVIPLERLKKVPALAQMPLLRRGQRLSVQPVAEKEWKAISELTP